MRKTTPVAGIPRFSRGLRWIIGSAFVCGFSASAVAAQNDFELLLSELTFGQAEPPSDGPLQDLDADPGKSTPSVKSAPFAERSRVPLADPPAGKLQSADPIRFPELPAEPPVTAPALSAPVRFVPPMTMTSDTTKPDSPPAAVDFEEVFSEPGVYGGDAVVGHGNGSIQGADCGTHRAPVLPPPSSLLGYFRSRPCNLGVWAGYEHERAAHCEHYHAHLHGHCECFTPRKKHSPLLHGPAVIGCGQCGKNSCDRTH